MVSVNGWHLTLVFDLAGPFYQGRVHGTTHCSQGGSLSCAEQCVLIVLIRNTNPRLRIDQAMKFFWFVATPLALVALMLAILNKPGW